MTCFGNAKDGPYAGVFFVCALSAAGWVLSH